MTVGKSIAAQTGYRLFHNHHSIELGLELFEFGDPPFSDLSGRIRRSVFESAAKSNLAGLIFTFVCAFELDSELEYLERMAENWTAESHRHEGVGGVYFVELTAPESIRIERNKAPDRLAAKKSKRDVERSEQNLINLGSEHQLNTDGNFPLEYPHLKIDNSTMSADEVASEVVNAFEL